MTTSTPMPRDKFISTFEAWLKKNKYDGVFYRNQDRWFIMNGAQKTYLPAIFQNYWDLLEKELPAKDKTYEGTA